MSRRRTGRFWPTAVQEELLVAALGDPVDATAAWRRVERRPGFSLDELERGSFELMPLIYRNLTSGGYEGPIMPRLKGIYRRSWVKNNLLLERTRDLAVSLREAGIQALFLEGPLLACRYYPDLALRPTTLVHLLVGEADQAAAVTRLGRVGWSERPGSGAYPGWRFLFDASANIAVLRTSFAFDFVPRGHSVFSTVSLLEAAEKQEAAGTEVPVPSPADALLAICVAGARVGFVPSTQWIVDAAMVLRRGDIDWARLIGIALDHGQALRFREAVDYLRGLPVPEPPAEVRERLAGAAIARRERLIYALASGSIRGPGNVPETLAEHLAATADESLPRVLATYPGRLRARWGLEHAWQLPLAAGRRVCRLRGDKRTA